MANKELGLQAEIQSKLSSGEEKIKRQLGLEILARTYRHLRDYLGAAKINVETDLSHLAKISQNRMDTYHSFVDASEFLLDHTLTYYNNIGSDKVSPEAALYGIAERLNQTDKENDK